MAEVTTEWCSNCEYEVSLPIKMGKYECPNCKEDIINCSMCEHYECNKCPIENC